MLGWIAVGVFRFGADFWAPPRTTIAVVVILTVIVGVIVSAAFGVVTQAEHLARRLGEPYGSLILTLSIVSIEVVLIAAVMLGPGQHPTIARDSVMAVAMIILNLVVGLALVIAGFRHAILRVNRTGVASYLGMLLPLLMIGLVLPTLIGHNGQYSVAQAIPVAVLTLLAYSVFLVLQTGKQRADFQAPQQSLTQGQGRLFGAGTQDRATGFRDHRQEVLLRSLLLIATVVPIVLLSQDMATYLDILLARAQAPVALSGIVIATIVFLPETVTAIRAAAAGEMQRVSNLCHGALVSTVGLTIPVVLLIGFVTGQPVVLGESPAQMVLLAVSLLLNGVSFLGGRPTAMHGIGHLTIFVVYLLVAVT